MTSPLQDLLDDLADSGWTISWAFQFAPDHWRVSIIHHSDIGEPQGNWHSFCADADSFVSALEDAMLRRNDADFIPTEAPSGVIDTTPAPTLTDILRLVRPAAPSIPFPRRI